MKNIFLFLLLSISSVVFSQEEDAWVYFNAKADQQIYFDSPETMLSQRALDRRANQSIALDLKDVPIDATYIRAVKAVSGITVMAKSKWMNALHIRGTQLVINSLKGMSFVEKVDFANKTLNQAGKTAKPFKQKQQTKSKKMKVDYAYGASGNQIKMLNGDVLHQQNYTGSGKIIAVLDAGFLGVNSVLPFKRLRDNNQILGGYNFVMRNDNFYSSDSHGTSVLSTMGGYVENELIGTAPNASYYLFITEDVRSENPVEESLWVEAAEKADSLGVDIINTSLGYFEYDNPAYSHTYSEMDGATAFISRGAEIAFSRGMFVVASAGNSGASANPFIAVPADAVSVLAIGAVDSGERKAYFSSIGPSYDQRVKPDVMAQGQATVVSDEFGTIGTANGTSFSGPVMAGMVASFWQAFPKKTNKEIKDLIIQSSDKYTAPTPLYGYGIPDFSKALTLSVEDVGKKYFATYPNPTSDFISVQLSENSNKGTMAFYTILGQKVLEKQLIGPVSTFSLKSLSNGIYIYKIESESFSKTGKIIKQ
jgi:hypothetical protein